MKKCILSIKFFYFVIFITTMFNCVKLDIETRAEARINYIENNSKGIEKSLLKIIAELEKINENLKNGNGHYNPHSLQNALNSHDDKLSEIEQKLDALKRDVLILSDEVNDFEVKKYNYEIIRLNDKILELENESLLQKEIINKFRRGEFS